MAKTTTVFLMICLAMLTIIPFTSASIADEDVSFRVPQFSNYDINRGCENNGEICGVLTACTITVVNAQTGTVIVNNAAMVNNGAYHTYALASGNTQLSGFYKADVYCTDTVDAGAESFYYSVVPSMENNTIQLIILAASALIVLGLAWMLKNEYVAFLSGILFILLGIYAMQYGFNGVASFYSQAVALVGLGIGIIIIFLSAYGLTQHSENNSSYSEEVFEDD